MALFRLPFGLASVLRRLGIAEPGARFDLSSTVVPVSLVDTDVAIQTITTPPVFGSPASAGEINNPAANTRMADTGALAAGTWAFLVSISCTAGAPNSRIKRRDAADAADIWSVAWQVATSSRLELMVFTIAAGERLVVEHVTGGVGGICQSAIWATKLA